MRRLLVNAISIALTFIAPLDAAGRDALFPLESGQGLRLHNVAVEAAVLAGKKGIKVTLTEETVRRLQAMSGDEADEAQARIGQYAIVEDVEFSDGVISAEIAGAPSPGTPAGARGFVGIGFRLQDGAYELFNLRLTNGRAEEQERRNHATQYSSLPNWPWFRLRKETPSRYESYVDLQPNVWTKVRIDVRGERARFYVHDQVQPTLIINDLKSGAKRSGTIALWVNYGTVAHFRKLRVRAAGR